MMPFSFFFFFFNSEEVNILLMCIAITVQMTKLEDISGWV